MFGQWKAPAGNPRRLEDRHPSSAKGHCCFQLQLIPLGSRNSYYLAWGWCQLSADASPQGATLALMASLGPLSTEIKNAQHQSSEIQFYSGTLLRTVAQETASQIVLRNCSKEVRKEVSIYVVLAKGYEQSNIHHGRWLLLVVMRNRCFS